MEVVRAQQVQHLPDLFIMLVSSLAVDEDVIYVHHHAVVEVLSEHAVHGSLKFGRRVGQAKAEHFELVVTKWRSERCLGYVFGVMRI